MRRNTMTYYEYAVAMNEVCLKVSQICKIRGDYGLSNFYSAAAKGFEELNNDSEEANKIPEDDREKSLKDVIKYVEEEQKKTASKIYEVLVKLEYTKEKAKEVSFHFRKNELTEDDKQYINIVSRYAMNESEKNQ